MASADPGDTVVFETRDAFDNQFDFGTIPADVAVADASRFDPLTGALFANGGELVRQLVRSEDHEERSEGKEEGQPMRRNALIICLTALLGSVVLASNPQPALAESEKAVAVIAGCTDPNITGMALFSEKPSEEGVKLVDVHVVVRGLPEGKHAVHIHETAACTPCTAARGHFDPGPAGNSSPDGNHPFHAGDLVNLEVKAEGGQGIMHTKTSRITLSPGPLSIFDADGSAIIVHVGPDTYCPGGPAAGCAGGARAACGILEPQD